MDLSLKMMLIQSSPALCVAKNFRKSVLGSLEFILKIIQVRIYTIYIKTIISLICICNKETLL